MSNKKAHSSCNYMMKHDDIKQYVNVITDLRKLMSYGHFYHNGHAGPKVSDSRISGVST